MIIDPGPPVPPVAPVTPPGSTVHSQKSTSGLSMTYTITCSLQMGSRTSMSVANSEQHMGRVILAGWSSAHTLAFPVQDPTSPSAKVKNPNARFMVLGSSRQSGYSLTLRSKQNDHGPCPPPQLGPSPQSTPIGGPGIGQVPFTPYANHPGGRIVPCGVPQHGPQQPPTSPPKSGQSGSYNTLHISTVPFPSRSPT